MTMVSAPVVNSHSMADPIIREAGFVEQSMALGLDYHIGTAQKMSVDIDDTPDLLLLIQQKLHIVQYRYSS